MSRKNIYFVTFGYDTVGVVCADTNIMAVRTILKEFGFKTVLDYKNTYPGSNDTKTNCRKRFRENDMYQTVRGWNEPLYYAQIAFDWFIESDLKQARRAISKECCTRIKQFMCVFPYINPVAESFTLKRLNTKQKADLWYCLDWSEPNELF